LLTLSIVSLASLFSFSAAAEDYESENWGSPVATYSNIKLGSGSEGIDLSATFGGYLAGVYKSSIEIAAKNDLEYYEANYLLLNSASESGVTIESTWNEDITIENTNGPGEFDYENIDTVAVGIFSKLNFPDPKLTAYPKMSVGYMLGNDNGFLDTTFVQLEVGVRYNIDEKIWVGATPAFTHSMKGEEIDEFTGTIEAGIKMSDTFGVSASVNEDQEFLGTVIFAF
jgi:hypothetical protein